MSVPYGGGYGYQPPVPGPSGIPGRLNWGWFSESFNIFSRAVGIWIGTVLIFGLINGIIQGILDSVFPDTQTTSSISTLRNRSGMSDTGAFVALAVYWVIFSFEGACLYGLAVKQVRGERVTFADAFSGVRYFGNMLLLGLIFGLLSTAGFFVFCAGIYIAGAFLIPSAAMVADGEGALPALSRSMETMKQDWINASLFVLVWHWVIIASIVTCGLGFLVTIPMLCITSALAYRDMAGISGMPVMPAGYGQPMPGAWPPAPGSAWPPPGQAPPYGQPGQYGQPGTYNQPPYGQPPQSQFGQPPQNQSGQSPYGQPPPQFPYGQPQSSIFDKAPKAQQGQQPPVLPPSGQAQSSYILPEDDNFPGDGQQSGNRWVGENPPSDGSDRNA